MSRISNPHILRSKPLRTSRSWYHLLFILRNPSVSNLHDPHSKSSHLGHFVDGQFIDRANSRNLNNFRYASPTALSFGIRIPEGKGEPGFSSRPRRIDISDNPSKRHLGTTFRRKLKSVNAHNFRTKTRTVVPFGHKTPLTHRDRHDFYGHCIFPKSWPFYRWTFHWWTIRRKTNSRKYHNFWHNPRRAFPFGTEIEQRRARPLAF